MLTAGAFLCFFTYCDVDEASWTVGRVQHSFCEEQPIKEPPPPSNPSNPLWPSGVSPEMVNQYVDMILKDPKINLSSVPDAIERTIYVSTVQTTLNVVYQALSSLHGTELLGHVLVLDRSPTLGDPLYLRAGNSRKIDANVLEAMADELLQNKAINQAWLPDIIERQIYSNCLLIIFTLLDRIADTLSVRLCGHELGFRFEPLTEPAARALVARQRRRRERLDLDPAGLDVLVAEMLRESQKATGSRSSVLPFYDSFLVAVHKTLCEYGVDTQVSA